jgi:hypothetical protein
MTGHLEDMKVPVAGSRWEYAGRFVRVRRILVQWQFEGSLDGTRWSADPRCFNGGETMFAFTPAPEPVKEGQLRVSHSAEYKVLEVLGNWVFGRCRYFDSDRWLGFHHTVEDMERDTAEKNS